MWVILIIMWLCVAVLCIRCINLDKDMQNEWDEMSLLRKAFITPVVPVAYLLIAAFGAFEK